MSEVQASAIAFSSTEARHDVVPFFPKEGAACAPLLFLLAGLSVSMTGVFRGLPVVPSALLAPLTVWGLLLILSEHRPPRFFQYALLLSLLSFAGALLCGYRLPQSESFPGGAIQTSGRVVLERSWGGRRAVLVDTRQGRYLMKLPPNRYVLEGDILSFSGVARSIAPQPGSSFREDLYWSARGASLEISPESISRRDGGLSLARRRTTLRKRMLLVLPHRTRGYLLAAVLGVRDPDLNDSHRHWGTSHLLAVSGFHVGLVALGVWKLLSIRRMRLLFSRRTAALLASLLLWGYALLAGGAPGALRAALMLQTLLVGNVLGRKGTPLNSVSLAALLLLFWRPAWFFDIGWRLSVMAALLLAALAERRPSFFMLPLSSVLIWFAAFPQVTAVFERVPAAGLLLNLIALPLFSVLYPLAALLSLPLLIGLRHGELLAGAAEGLFALWEWIAEILAGIVPWTLSWSPMLATIGGVLFILTIAGGLFPLRGRTIAGVGFFLLGTVLLL